MRKVYVCIAVSVILVVVCVAMGVRSIREYSQGLDDAAVTATQPAATKTTVPAKTEAPKTTSAPQTTQTEPETEKLVLPDGIDFEEAVEYFASTCIGSEYSEGGDEFIRKFTVPVRYYIDDPCEDEDLEAIERVCDFMNSVPGFPGISQVQSAAEANFTVYFGSEEHIKEMIDITDEPANGLNRIFWSDGGYIVTGEVGIVSDLDTDKRRCVIWEEFMQATGIVRDSELRDDSMFSIWPDIHEDIPDIDRAVFSLLYNDAVEPGMSSARAVLAVAGLPR